MTERKLGIRRPDRTGDGLWLWAPAPVWVAGLRLPAAVAGLGLRLRVGIAGLGLPG